MRCLTDYMAVVRRNVVMPEQTAAELEQVLQGPIAWNYVHSLDSHDCHAYEARIGNWHLVLADFSIADQTGHKAGDRGQTLAVVNTAASLALMGDYPEVHRLANWLYARHLLNRLNSFVGTGKKPGVRIFSKDQTEQRYTIDSPEAAGAAATWLQAHIKALNGATWGIPETGSFYRFDEVTKTAYYWGNHHAATYGLLKLLGWELVEQKSTN